MKFSANSAVAFALMTGAMFVTSCANDVETDINIDPTGNAISFSPVVGHSTRATETTIDNLGDFAVVARGMYHDGVLYDTYLIGSQTAGDIAKRQGNITDSKGTWVLDHSVYWPSTLNKVLFFAYTAVKNGETYSNIFGDGTGTAPTFGFDGDNPYIGNFKPSKATAVENNIQADGKNQRDLLVAYTQQEKIKSQTNVHLTFEHALTQVSITAKQENKLATDHRIVKIKGAWIVNAAESGTLNATQIKAEGSPIENPTYDYEKSWTVTTANKTAFGSVWSDVIQLRTDASQNILRNFSLMLIPENLTAWDPVNDKENAAKGAYIMLLCRVELEHDKATHDGDKDDTEIGVVGDKHYHQLFPVNKTAYDASEYGFACVPLSSDWNTNGLGKHYTYNLNICGSGTGAGKYPPTMTAEKIATLVPADLGIKVVTNDNAITGKNPGDNVLDDPIQFTVDVADWAAPDNTWKPGNGDF